MSMLQDHEAVLDLSQNLFIGLNEMFKKQRILYM